MDVSEGSHRRKKAHEEEEENDGGSYACPVSVSCCRDQERAVELMMKHPYNFT